MLMNEQEEKRFAFRRMAKRSSRDFLSSSFIHEEGEGGRGREDSWQKGNFFYFQPRVKFLKAVLSVNHRTIIIHRHKTYAYEKLIIF